MTDESAGRRHGLIAAVKMAGREQSAANVVMLNVFGERLGLGVNDVKSLDALNRLGPMTAGAIAEHTGLATPSVTALVDRLEEKGFVSRVRDREDRRRVIVTLNTERYGELYATFGSFVRSMDAMLEPYSDQELHLIHDFLVRCAQVMREETQRIAEMVLPGDPGHAHPGDHVAPGPTMPEERP